MPIPNDIYVFGKLSLGEIFPMQTFFFLAPVALFQLLWSYPPWKIDPGVCGDIRTPSYNCSPATDGPRLSGMGGVDTLRWTPWHKHTLEGQQREGID